MVFVNTGTVNQFIFVKKKNWKMKSPEVNDNKSLRKCL